MRCQVVSLLATASVSVLATVVAIQPLAVAVAGGASACGYGNLDFSSLTGVDYRIVNPQTNDIYRLAVCGALSPSAGVCYNATDAPHQSVCFENSLPPMDVGDWMPAADPEWAVTNVGTQSQTVSYTIYSQENSCEIGWRDYTQYQTQVAFVCSQQAGQPKLVQSSQACEFLFEIPTPLACASPWSSSSAPAIKKHFKQAMAPVKKHRTATSSSVKVTTPVKAAVSSCGVGPYDFSSLAGVDHRVVDDGTGMAYWLSVCGALSPSAGACYNATEFHQSVCYEPGQEDLGDWMPAADPDFSITNIGTSSQAITYSIYSQQESCALGWPNDFAQYQTQVSFVCAQQTGAPKYVGSSQPCQFLFEIPTPLACPKSHAMSVKKHHHAIKPRRNAAAVQSKMPASMAKVGASSCSYGGYDFSSFAGVDHRVVDPNPADDNTFVLNVCGRLTPAAGVCYNATASPDQSVCLESTIPPSNVGDWSAPQWSITNYGAPNQYVSYMIQSQYNSCQTGWRQYSYYQTQVSFVCAQEAGEPKYVPSQQPCEYSFEIPTPLACPQSASASVKAQSADSAAHAVDPSESCEDQCTEGEGQAMQACGWNLQCIESVQAGVNICLAKCPSSAPASIKAHKQMITPQASCEDRCEEGSSQAMQACGSNLQCIEDVQAGVNICLDKCSTQAKQMMYRNGRLQHKKLFKPRV